MSGEKRKLIDSDSDDRASFREETQSLMNVAKKLRAQKAVGLADSEIRDLIPDQTMFIKSLKAAG